MKKERADRLVLQQGLTKTIDEAKRFIMAGKIYTENNQRVDTAGEKLPLDTPLKIKGATPKYASRGGFKLEKAIAVFQIDLKGKIMLDIGSSTGGFTDAALQNGAKLCYALDVGTNQLAWKLRTDERVVVMEQTNFRHSKKEDFTHGQPEMASIDVSFISLDKILPVLAQILQPEGDVLALIKPQFEAERTEIGAKGIVKDPDVHRHVLEKIVSFSLSQGYVICGLDYSPITGGEGNIEYLAHLKLRTPNQPVVDAEVDEQLIEDVVLNAHRHFEKD